MQSNNSVCIFKKLIYRTYICKIVFLINIITNNTKKFLFHIISVFFTIQTEYIIYSKIEQDNLEDEDNADTLTEDDLNFIDDINHGENELLEPVVDAPENFEDDQAVSIAEEEEQTPVVPVYPADTPYTAQSFEQGDHVSHPKYGEGVIEKMIRYGNKTLCSINFVNVGRRLLDPAISEISKL